MMQLGTSVLVALITAGGYVMVAWINGNNKQQQKEIANNLEKITNQMQSIQEEVKRTNKLAELNVESIRHSQQFLLYDAMERALKRGYTTTAEIREIGALFKNYEDRGGNGSIHDMHEKFMTLGIHDYL